MDNIDVNIFTSVNKNVKDLDTVINSEITAVVTVSHNSASITCKQADANAEGVTNNKPVCFI